MKNPLGKILVKTSSFPGDFYIWIAKQALVFCVLLAYNKNVILEHLICHKNVRF